MKILAHDRQRRIIQPAFHPNLIKKYGGIITNYTLNICQLWQDETSTSKKKQGNDMAGENLKTGEKPPFNAINSCPSSSTSHSLLFPWVKIGIAMNEKIAGIAFPDLKAARIVYTSSITLFSFFWIYDIIMLLRGFSEEYLDSENLVFIALKKHSRLLVAICFLSLMVVLSINEGLSDSREIEAQKSLPIIVAA